MTTIKAGGLKKEHAPSPLALRGWSEDWRGQLAGLSNWNTTDDGCESSCTTTSTKAVTEQVVEQTLDDWKEQDPGHRHYSIDEV